MNVLIVFNHPAPYKVKLFNTISKKINLFVIFERLSARDRPEKFYTEKEYHFEYKILSKNYLGSENSINFEVKNYIKKNHKKYDFILMNGYSNFTEQIAINYMIRKKIPYILFTNGGVIKEKESFIKGFLKRRYISHASAYLSPNEETNEYLRYYGAKNQIINFPYCTYFEKDIKESNLPEELRSELRKKYNLPEGKLFISASSYITRKNNIALFDAFKGRKENLVLYGDGPLKREYEKYLKENNISNVLLKQFIPNEELLKIMSCCDAFVTLSKQDIFGHTTMEALAAGIPVISTKTVVSSLAVIKDGQNGYLIESKEDLDKALQNVDYSLMSKNCIETAKNFSIEKESAKIIEGLEKLAK